MSNLSGYDGYETNSHKVEKQVDERLDQTIAQLVEALIGEYIPLPLRHNIERQRDELDSTRIQVHNLCVPYTCALRPNKIITSGLSARPVAKTGQFERGSTSVNRLALF